MMTELFQKVLREEDLTRSEAATVMDTIMEGGATPAQIAGFLVAIKKKGEKAPEVAGFVQSMRRHSVRVEIDDKGAVDGCGTGGDGSHSFNISTAASLVAAAAGVTVAKHGNRSMSSRCGSADLLEAAGAAIDPDPQRVQECINELQFGFMFAPRYHPAMKYAASPRKELGVRTVFNILGPMTNPAGVSRQLVGVYDRALMSLVAEVLNITGSSHVIVAHSQDGLDEFSVSAPTDYLELKGETISHKTISPEDVGLGSYPRGAIDGGDAAANLSILHGVLSGEKDAYRDAVLLNAGVMIYIADKADSIKAGIVRASEAVDFGLAREKLERWVAFTKK